MIVMVSIHTTMSTPPSVKSERVRERVNSQVKPCVLTGMVAPGVVKVGVVSSRFWGGKVQHHQGPPPLSTPPTKLEIRPKALLRITSNSHGIRPEEGKHLIPALFQPYFLAKTSDVIYLRKKTRIPALFCEVGKLESKQPTKKTVTILALLL